MTYGRFAQWFALPDVTLEANGGRLSGSLGGYYGDAGAIVYPWSDLALNLGLDYAKGSSGQPELSDAAFSAEFMPVRDIPASLALGYTRAEYHDLEGDIRQSVNVFTVALKVYLGGAGADGSL